MMGLETEDACIVVSPSLSSPSAIPETSMARKMFVLPPQKGNATLDECIVSLYIDQKINMEEVYHSIDQ
jgi:hypothetical protein